jgi:hypothetical protein
MGRRSSSERRRSINRHGHLERVNLLQSTEINLSTVIAGQSVGIRQVSDLIWLVSFMDYDLGYFDHETCRLEPIENPFGPKVLVPAPGANAALAKPLAEHAP